MWCDGWCAYVSKMRELYWRVGAGPVVPALGWLAIGKLDLRLGGIELGAGLRAGTRTKARVALGFAALAAP